MTLSDIQGQSLIASLYKYDSSNISAAVHQISTGIQCCADLLVSLLFPVQVSAQSFQSISGTTLLVGLACKIPASINSKGRFLENVEHEN